MMAYPSMLMAAAMRAGMKVPPDGTPIVAMGAIGHVDVDVGFSPFEYPHFAVFCAVQLWRPVKWGEHWENAQIIADIPMSHPGQVNLKELIRKGLHYGS